MGWASGYITKLLEGKTVQFRPRGNSMQPRIESGQLCTVTPLGDDVVQPNDIVLCKVHGKEYLHLVKAVRHGGLYQIGNNKGHINGWINRKSVFGKLVGVEE